MSTKLVRNPDIVIREENEHGALMFNPDTNQIKLLNNMAITIFRLCDGSHDIPAIIKTIKESYDQVPADLVDEHVTLFVDYMLKNQMVGSI
ncbi:MAG: PqqD family peptide modification chaperone [Chloroflexi bacterium]|nr:PqqD family peptide modification chaperone [Chloroflexota bacterium]